MHARCGDTGLINAASSHFSPDVWDWIADFLGREYCVTATLSSPPAYPLSWVELKKCLVARFTSLFASLLPNRIELDGLRRDRDLAKYHAMIVAEEWDGFRCWT